MVSQSHSGLFCWEWTCQHLLLRRDPGPRAPGLTAVLLPQPVLAMVCCSPSGESPWSFAAVESLGDWVVRGREDRGSLSLLFRLLLHHGSLETQLSHLSLSLVSVFSLHFCQTF